MKFERYPVGSRMGKRTKTHQFPAVKITMSSATLTDLKFAVFLIFLLCSTASHAEKFCPASIATKQSAAATPKNYQAVKDHVFADPFDPNRLWMVEFFIGKPNAPENIRPDHYNNTMSIWNLRDEAPKTDVWINCYYTNTELTLLERLPSELNSCIVHYVNVKHVMIQGMPVITSVECQ